MKMNATLTFDGPNRVQPQPKPIPYRNSFPPPPTARGYHFAALAKTASGNSYESRVTYFENFSGRFFQDFFFFKLFFFKFFSKIFFQFCFQDFFPHFFSRFFLNGASQDFFSRFLKMGFGAPTFVQMFSPTGAATPFPADRNIIPNRPTSAPKPSSLPNPLYSRSSVLNWHRPLWAPERQSTIATTNNQNATTSKPTYQPAATTFDYFTKIYNNLTKM